MVHSCLSECTIFFFHLPLVQNLTPHEPTLIPLIKKRMKDDCYLYCRSIPDRGNLVEILSEKSSPYSLFQIKLWTLYHSNYNHAFEFYK